MKLRFSIRDLLWLTLVVAMAVAWWLDRGRLHRELSEWKQHAIWYDFDHGKRDRVQK